MGKNKKLQKAFGLDEYGFELIPQKISNVKISRFQKTDFVGGCPFCFPHGIDCTNSKISKIQRNWKTQRKKQYKTPRNGKS